MSNRHSAASIRRAFLDYFAGKGHAVVASSPLVPVGDPTLLFVNAGMVQFKDTFLGAEKRPYTRATTSQKCLRVSGKHNDFENVGRTARHHTFFEMLGNFSFGDYFKEDAIAYAWEFLTGVLGLDPKDLWVTVFETDDEAHAIWTGKVGVAADRVVRLGEKDNFWAMGDTGPCGPCSEILVDQGPSVGCGRPECRVGCDCDRYLEIWNLVFMQYNRDASGKLAPLPKPSIDTGMGLERVSAIRQGVSSNYDTDLFRPLIGTICEVTGAVYGGSDAEEDVAVRVLADHARAAAFLIADGILPSNEGRGYVLRRILRRAIRFGTKLGMNDPFFHRITDRVVDLMADPYRELAEHRASIVRLVRAEEERFGRTLAAGIAMLAGEIAELRGKGLHVIPGATVFTLYDTYGFPPDLTRDLASESRLKVDEEGFAREMERQREKARAARDVAGAEAVAPAYAEVAAAGAIPFTGYGSLDGTSRIRALIRDGAAVDAAAEGEEVELVLAATPFYAESGGQVGDRGTITGPSGEFAVMGTAAPVHGLTVHRGRVARGRIAPGDEVVAKVDAARRRDTAANHTATHLLQSALRQVLGDHVRQSGSLVTPDRLRFDYTHFSAPTPAELSAVEDLVNEAIRDNTPVETEETEYARAVELGATALFGEKYRDVVRVVRVPGVSMELCGGTHACRTGDIGLFRIVSEGGVSSGVRRIEAVTGRGALAEVRRLDGLLREVGARLKAPVEDVPRRVEKLAESLKAAGREIEELRRQAAGGAGGQAGGAFTVGDVEVVVRKIPGAGVKELRPAADGLRGPGNRVVFLGGESEGKASIVVAVDAPLTNRLSAAALISPLAGLVGGRGGGRPDFAQAGGPEGGRLDEALGMAARLVGDALGGAPPA